MSNGQALGIPDNYLKAATDTLERFYSINRDIPALLSLGHLAHRSGVSYRPLRLAVERWPKAYRHFTIRKRAGGRRAISVPHPELMKAQRWLAVNILNKQDVHPASHAFKPGSSITQCAARHCGARWLVKLDIAGFFDSISEISVYRIFRELGYEPLMAFELARLTTCIPLNLGRYRFPAWRNHMQHVAIEKYKCKLIGHLPQGAPTSPMLSNLVMGDIDEKIAREAEHEGLSYTRYSDDLTFSTRRTFNRKRGIRFVRLVSRKLNSIRLFLNERKTVIVPPGARKVVLGLIVNGDTPTLSRDFRSRMRQHLYYLEKNGPIKHMQERGFETVLGMKRHIRGQIDFARMVDKAYGNELLERFERVDWPL